MKESGQNCQNQNLYQVIEMNEKSARETANREENKDTELKVDDDSTP